MKHEFGHFVILSAGHLRSGGKFELAARLFHQLMTGSDFPEFLTLVGYEHLE